MMTIDEAIQHCEEIVCEHNKCASEHKQLAEWLKELKELKTVYKQSYTLSKKDDKIREALIHLINEQDGFLTAINGISIKDIIAWLKKQDNKPVPKFSIGQRIRNRKGEMPAFVIDRIEDDSYKGKNGESISVVFQDDWELVEQNHTGWSEEDEKKLKSE